MGKLIGIFQMTGKVQGLSIYKHKHYGILVRKDASHSKERMENDPAFEQVKKNYNLFGEASSTARLIRDMLKPIEKAIADGRMNNRLVSTVREIYVKAGREGEHPLHSPFVDQLRGFSFNQYHSFLNTCYGAVHIRRAGNEITVEISKADFDNIPGATHLRIVSSVGEIDFVTRLYSRSDDVSEFIKVDASSVDVTLRNKMTGEYPVAILVVGIMYYQFTNGRYYRLDNGKGRSAELMQVFRNDDIHCHLSSTTL